MSKLLLSLFLTMVLISNFIYAETNKSAKKTKLIDTNKTMTDDEFMKEFMKLSQEVKDEKIKTSKTQDELDQAQKKLAATIKLEKTVDELGKQLGVNKK